MLRWLGMGSPTGLGGGASVWDFWPLVGFVASFLLLRYVVDVRMRIPVILGCLVGGALFASVVNAWGIVFGLAAAVGLALFGRLLRLAPHSP